MMLLEKDLTDKMSIYKNSILKGDCIEILKQLPDKSVDLVFADPPYNLQIQDSLYRPNNTKVNGVFDDWDKFSSFQEYDTFSENWLNECRRVLKDTGTIWVIGSYHNIFRLGKIMMDLGFWILNDVQWYKTNPMPNFKGTRFTNATETLLWCKKSENQKTYTFNYRMMKYLNDGKQMKSVWEIPLCTGSERLKDENGNKLHSTQKPEALLKRVILSASNAGDIVLDPFFGSGTTGAVAKKLNRNFIGIEKEDEYIKIAHDRISSIDKLDEIMYVSLPEKKDVQKVPFIDLIKEGYINPGEILYFHGKKSKSAIITKDGNLLYKNKEGSIHKIGSTIQNSLTCNGWVHWEIEREGKMLLIDEIRAEYRKAHGLL